MKSENIKAFEDAAAEIIPFGFYYNCDRNIAVPKGDLAKNEWVNVIKSRCRINNHDFISEVKNLSEEAFLKELNVQFAYFDRRGHKNVSKWLKHTRKLIHEGIGNKYLLFAFDEWYKMKQPLINDIDYKYEVFMKLVGADGNHNNSKSASPVYYYIDNVLLEYKLKPSEAAKILLQMKGVVSPDWDKIVVPKILNYLKEVEGIDNKIEPPAISKFDEYNRAIFPSSKAFELFDKMIEKRPKSRYKDHCVFVIRQMIKDKLILDVKWLAIKDYLSKVYSIDLDKLKSLHVVTTDTRTELYKSVRNSIKV